KPQDHYSIEVPKGSGNPNPTASTSNPPADPMETLTVETPIPTASSPVPTAYSTDSQEPSNESNGVEANISNMEIAITASPTPTLRIHKDHPKSHIIGPLDTPIQTRNKSKVMDVKSAFLYGTIDEEVYVMQPLGFQDLEFPAKVYKVEKAMYGLHQAPRAWYGTLSKYLLKNGFQRGTIDQTLFIKRQRGDFILVQVFVDDIIFGSSNL
nr:retrovirus-related Pol polyprotein from transposon TNT 1-94 [Tanacetum cinerariifolium]